MNAPINQLGRFCLFLVISLFLFAGCSFFDFDNQNTASVVFEIPDKFTNKVNTRESRQILPNTSRDSLALEDENFYFDIALKGGFEDSKTILLGKEKRFSFDDIPVGSELWAEAEIYKNEADSKVTLYTGKSEVITVVAGENQLALKLEKSDSENQDSSEPEIIYVDIYATARTLAANELCDGSEEAPFATIADALAYITDLDNSEENYKIITSGTFAENVLIQGIPAAHLMIEGDGGEVESKITGDGVAGYPFESYQNITLKNISVIANGNLGAKIQAGTLTLENGAKLKCTAAETGGSFGVVVYGNIIMNGNSEISGFLQTSGNTIIVYENSKITMNDDSKIYNCKAGTDNYSGGGGVYLESASLEMNDNAKIYSCQSSYGGGVYLGTKSGSFVKPSLVMNDDSIIENCTGKIGGGVYVGSGTFTMNDNAVISNCTGSMISGVNNKYSAGGVHVDEASIFTMNNNSKITECTGHSAAAGGVWVQGTFYMNGGEISSNTAPYNSMAGAQNGVGGIYLNGTSDSSKATFIMKGGKICDNNGNKYGAVSMSGYCVFDMQGGEISGNLASAVNSDKVPGVMIGWTQTLTNNEYHPSIFKMSGDAVVASDNDVRVSDHTVLTIAGALTGTSSVAKLSFDTYQSETAVISVADGAETTIGAVVEKFTIKAKTVDSVTTNYMLDGGGKLRVKKAAPDAVGDIVFNDGSAVAYASDLSFNDSQKANAVCVIFYKGSETDKLGERTLGVGLKQSSGKKWCLGTSNACTPVSNVFEGKTISDLECTCSKGDEIDSSSTTFTGNMDGSDDWQILKAFLAENGGDDTNIEGNYPVWEWVNGYGTQFNYPGAFANGWYLPTLAEGAMIGAEKYTVNNALDAIGGSKIIQTYYWTSNAAGTMARTFNPKTGVPTGSATWNRDTNSWTGIAIREF